MKGSLKTVMLGAAMTTTMVLTSLAPAAVAGEAGQAPAPSAGRACVMRAVAAGTSEVARAVAPVCFESFAAAISFATDGTVRLPSTATDLTQADLDAGRRTGRVASTVIGMEYENSDFGGTTWIISQANGCTDGGAEVWLRADLTGDPMNNVISSAKTFAGCKSRHFDLANFGGSSYLCGCSQMSTMSDKTTSIRWSATGF